MLASRVKYLGIGRRSRSDVTSCTLKFTESRVFYLQVAMVCRKHKSCVAEWYYSASSENYSKLYAQQVLCCSTIAGSGYCLWFRSSPRRRRYIRLKISLQVPREQESHPTSKCSLYIVTWKTVSIFEKRTSPFNGIVKSLLFKHMCTYWTNLTHSTPNMLLHHPWRWWERERERERKTVI